MVCEDGDNQKIIGIKGNFDDAQNALKRLLDSKTFKAELQKDNIKLSAANSVNFGRIIFQIIQNYLVICILYFSCPFLTKIIIII